MNNEGRPVICIDMKKSRIRIHKSTLHLLGDPGYVELLVNPNDMTILIAKSGSDDPLSHRVRMEVLLDNCYELYSRELISRLMGMDEGMEAEASYRIYGEMVRGTRAACFRMTDKVLLPEKERELIDA